MPFCDPEARHIDQKVDMELSADDERAIRFDKCAHGIDVASLMNTDQHRSNNRISMRYRERLSAAERLDTAF